MHGYTQWWYICEVRPVVAQNAVNRHESTDLLYIDIRAAIVMTTYPVLNPHDAPDNYGNDLFLCISCIW